MLIGRVEKKMEEMMSKYDPSHDAYHGMCRPTLSFDFLLFRGIVREDAIGALKGCPDVGHALALTVPMFSYCIYDITRR